MRSRRRWQLIALLLSAALLACCGRAPEAATKGPRVVVPASRETGSQDLKALTPMATSSTGVAPKVAIGSDEKLIAVVVANLNLDRSDEQILVTKDTDGKEPRIRISVVEYDDVLQTYRRTWEDLTSATDERYFTATTEDLVGDHSVEIICQGTTADNRPTMDVYRRSIADGTRLSYSLVFSAAAADIAILREVRSQAYLSGDADGKPFAIMITEPDPESPGAVDLLKTTFQWSTRDKRYLAAGRTRVQGEAMEREQLQALFLGNSPDEYLQFMAGSWIRSGTEGQADTSSIGELIRFSPPDRTLQIYSARSRVQEEYVWEKADCYYANVVIRNARNSILPDITKDVRVSVQSLQEVLVSVESTNDRTDSWRATYRRVSDKALAQQLSEPQKAESVMQPTGLYESADGEQLVFQAPRFTWVRQGQTLSGGFYLYRLDRLVLGLLIQKGYGQKPEERAYIVEQSTRAEPKRTVLSLVLHPAELTVYGARQTSDDVITLTQVRSQEEQSSPTR